MSGDRVMASSAKYKENPSHKQDAQKNATARILCNAILSRTVAIALSIAKRRVKTENHTTSMMYFICGVLEWSDEYFGDLI